MNVLIIEDDPGLASVLKSLFDPVVDFCVTTDSIHDALQLMTIHKFDITSLDVNTKDLQGHETLSKIPEMKKTNPDGLVVVYTGLTDPEIEKQAMDAGADGFISKSGSGGKPKGIIGSWIEVLSGILRHPKTPQQSVRLLETLVNRLASRCGAPGANR